MLEPYRELIKVQGHAGYVKVPIRASIRLIYLLGRAAKLDGWARDDLARHLIAFTLLTSTAVIVPGMPGTHRPYGGGRSSVLTVHLPNPTLTWLRSEAANANVTLNHLLNQLLIQGLHRYLENRQALLMKLGLTKKRGELEKSPSNP